jgi:hypothetical protein
MCPTGQFIHRIDTKEYYGTNEGTRGGAMGYYKMSIHCKNPFTDEMTGPWDLPNQGFVHPKENSSHWWQASVPYSSVSSSPERYIVGIEVYNLKYGEDWTGFAKMTLFYCPLDTILYSKASIPDFAYSIIPPSYADPT